MTHDRVTKLLSTKSKAWTPITCCCFVIFLIIRGDTVVIFNSNLSSMVRKVDYDRLFINHKCTVIMWLMIWHEKDTRRWASFPLYREFFSISKNIRNVVILCLTAFLRHRNSKCCFFFFFFESFYFLIFTHFHNQGRPYHKMLYCLKNYMRFQRLVENPKGKIMLLLIIRTSAKLLI